MEGEGKEMVVSAEEHVGGLGYNGLGQSSVIKGLFLRVVEVGRVGREGDSAIAQ
jgi:hypothetical protein